MSCISLRTHSASASSAAPKNANDCTTHHDAERGQPL
jgi:hypothetical protein